MGTRNHMRSLSIIFIVILFHSCNIVANRTIHYEGGKKVKHSNICEAHEVKMHKKLVKTTFGIYDPNPVIYDKKNPHVKSTLHLGCTRRGWPRETLGKIYVCPVCQKGNR
jgi:hypothetical protein